VTDNATDFWRETHYGFTHDNGHLFGHDTGGDFTMQVRVRANYDALYDQAGIMIRLDERNWLKAGIEKSDGHCQLSSVLTVDRSDWATGAYGGDPADFWMRATVSDGVIRSNVDFPQPLRPTTATTLPGRISTVTSRTTNGAVFA
jgi:regulation of enolase protein 1 (concanavalin A-like superfamily)